MGENEASLLSDILRARLCDTRPHVTAFGREGRGDYNHEAKAYSDPWIVRRASFHAVFTLRRCCIVIVYIFDPVSVNIVFDNIATAASRAGGRLTSLCFLSSSKL